MLSSGEPGERARQRRDGCALPQGAVRGVAPTPARCLGPRPAVRTQPGPVASQRVSTKEGRADLGGSPQRARRPPPRRSLVSRSAGPRVVPNPTSRGSTPRGPAWSTELHRAGLHRGDHWGLHLQAQLPRVSSRRIIPLHRRRVSHVSVSFHGQSTSTPDGAEIHGALPRSPTSVRSGADLRR